jgi:hypothetical protein
MVFLYAKGPIPITPSPVRPAAVAPVSNAVLVTVDGQSVIVEAAPAVAPAQTGATSTTGQVVQSQPQAVTAMMPEAFNIATFAQTFGKNFGDFVRVLPSLLQGARQGVQLIQTISSLFGGLDAIGDVAGGIL